MQLLARTPLTSFSMLNKLLHFTLYIISPIVFWLAVWQIGALAVDRSYFLPTVQETADALFRIIREEDFFYIVLMTLVRVLRGIFIGTVFGSVLAVLSHKFKFVYSLVSPLLSVVKATPVASVIILLWISMDGDDLSVFIAFLMVLPIIWQNLYNAFSSIDKDLTEITKSYEFSYLKRLRILVLPTLESYFIPAFITAIGLAIKSEIAAEIIAGVKDSVGRMIYHSKDAYDTASVFAWTIVGILLSILLEKFTKCIFYSRLKKIKRAEVRI